MLRNLRSLSKRAFCAENCNKVSAFPVGDPFCVVAIESSCDDTGVAIVESNRRVLADLRAGQAHIHEEFGGVNPIFAARAHNVAFPKLLKKLSSYYTPELMGKVVGVAATVGPGLKPCLHEGIEVGLRLAKEFGLPFFPVNHLEGHLLSPRLEERQGRDVEFPFVGLILSGGHCQAVLARNVGEYVVLGETVDDSIGEAFDKTARMLGLSVGGGGGANLERLARTGNPFGVKMPIPMARKERRHEIIFSFSGLKSHTRRIVRQEMSISEKADIAASFQRAAFQHVVEKAKLAVEQAKKELEICSLAVCGGVASNSLLMDMLKEFSHEKGLQLYSPSQHLCSDNAAMIGWAAIERLQRGKHTSVPPMVSLKPLPKWSLEDTDYIMNAHG